jgi:hypothetical protein
MTFTAVSYDIPLQPGLKAFNVWASGTITKGQGVALSPAGPDPNKTYVYAPDGSSQRLFGIAGYTKTHNNPIQVYGPGNLVRAKLSGNVTAGSMVGLVFEGHLGTYSKYPKHAIVVKGTASTGDGEILIIDGQD